MLTIRKASAADRDAIWIIFHEVVAPGDTYTFDRDISREDALGYWFADGNHTYVAELDALAVGDTVGVPGKVRAGLVLAASPTEFARSRIVGTYILKPNQGGGGAHVANAGFMVAADAQGKGIGRAMAGHCLGEARRFGYRAMQFNFVISTNESAVHLWKELGFEIVGTLPGAFKHPQRGFVDVYVMYRTLE